MRHLIDTYIEADEPRTISPFDGMGLLELIVKTGIAEAISKQLGGLKGDRKAVAETIENNVRRKIIKEHLNDPAYYETMSALLDEIIAARNAKAIEYEEYLKRIADLAKQVEAGHAEETPEPLKRSPALRALYNNLRPLTLRPPVRTDQASEEGIAYAATAPDPQPDPVLALALRLDEAIRKVRPDGWRGVQARERVIKAALFEILKDVSEVERLFLIIKAQGEY
jgi:type I restriction enzyme R subunit